MNKIKKVCVKGVLLIIIIIVSISILNRIVYGTFNVFGNPTRITIGSTWYTTNGYVLTLKGKDKPKANHEISGVIDKLTGKRIYYINPKYLEPGVAIYLHLHDDKYLVFSWGGGE